MSAPRGVDVAVLLVAYGGPDSLDDVEEFLLDVRGGRPTTPAFLQEVKARYRRIGGCSPLLARTTAQAEALGARLGPSHTVRVAMRHWQPRVADVVREVAESGIRRVVAIPMTPYDSRYSTGAYIQKLREAAALVVAAGGAAPEITVARSWHRVPGLVDAFEDRIRAALGRGTAAMSTDFEGPGLEAAATGAASQGPGSEAAATGAASQGPGLEAAATGAASQGPGLEAAATGAASQGHGGVAVIFTAHSLPARVLASGDPYVEQLRDTASTLAARVGLAETSWRFAFQSPGRTPDPWIGPFVEETLAEMAAEGWKRFLVVPIGFVCDHVEILFDVDIVLQQKARELGVDLARTESLNEHPSFIAALECVVAAAEGRASVPMLLEDVPI